LYTVKQLHNRLQCDYDTIVGPMHDYVVVVVVVAFYGRNRKKANECSKETRSRDITPQLAVHSKADCQAASFIAVGREG